MFISRGAVLPWAGVTWAPRGRFPQAGAEEASVAPEAAASKEPKKEMTPRVDWAPLLRRTFGFDVFTCLVP
jgi:hypothetical protein